MSVTTSCMCPSCQAVRDMRLSPSLGLLACPACGAAFTVAELQEAAYSMGYDDAAADAQAGAGRAARRRRS